MKEDNLYRALRYLLAHMSKDKKPTEVRRIVKTAMSPRRRIRRSARVMRIPSEAKTMKTRKVNNALFPNKPMAKEEALGKLVFTSSKNPLPPVTYRYPTNF